MSAACRDRSRWSICWSRRTTASRTITRSSIAQARQAVADIVAHQVAIGIDVVSDGEASKIGYATYIKDRLTGFGGEPFVPKPNATWRTIRSSASAWYSSPGRRSSAGFAASGRSH